MFTIESLPRSGALVDELFAADLRDGTLNSPLGIGDVWVHSNSENTNRKIWAAKFAARHPNLALVDFVSFRCGHDAAILHVIEGIARCSNTPYFCFHDMDQNVPFGSIRLRLETIDYYLREFQKG